MKGKFYLLTLLLCLAVTTVVVAGPPSSEDEDGTNLIKTVEVSEQEDGTYITLEGSQRATYSVFKLHKPLRLFVDISNSRLDNDLRRAPMQIGNGVVGQMALLEFSDDVQQIARMIVSFDTPAGYDVRSEGNKIVVFIDGVARNSGGAVAAGEGSRSEEQQKELDRARRALAEKERRLAETERRVAALERSLREARPDEKDDGKRDALEQSLEAERTKAERLRAELSSRETRLERLEEAVSAEKERVRALEVDRRKLAEERDAARTRADSLAQERDAARTRADSLAQERDAARTRADSLAQERDAAHTRADSLAQERDAARTRAEKLARERDAARTRVDKLARERDGAQTRAEKLARERDAARTRAESLSKASEKDQGRLRALESDLSDARKDLERAEAARSAAVRDTARLEGELEQLRTKAATQDREAKELRERVSALKRASDAARTKARSGDSAAQERVKALETEIAARSAELTDLEKRIDRATGEVSAKRKELETTAARVKESEARTARARDEAARAESARVAQAEKARRTEQERLDALEAAREKEEARLASIRVAREKEEARLASAQAAREKAERAAEAAAAARAPASDSRQTSDTRLTSVKETGDKAEVTLKAQATSAIVETSNNVKAVRFQQKGEVSRIIIELDRPGDFETVPWKAGKASLKLNGADLPRSLERTLDTQAFGGTVRYVSSYEDESGAVHVVAHVPTATTEIVRQSGAQLIWEFSSIGVGSGVGTPEHAGAVAPARPSGTTSAPPTFGGGASRRATSESQVPPWQRRPTRIARKRLSVELRGADVTNVLRLIAREGNVNIVAGDDVKGAVTMRLENVLLADAFITILKSLDLGYEQDGEIIRVAPVKLFEDAAAKRREEIVASFPLQPLEVILIPINYSDAQQVSRLVNTVLSSRGEVSVDPRTNTLVIKDVAQNLAAAQQLVLGLDTQTPQILIEARIVETNDAFTRQIGVQWGGDFLSSPAGGNPTGLVFPSVVGVAGAATDGQAPLGGLVGAPNFAVNLPAAIGTGSGGGFGLTLGSVGGAGNLALRLSALENEGHIKIVSAPRILTMDNISATISSGTSIPVSVVSAAGVQTVFVEANLQLSVTPHVTQDGNVQMELLIDKSEPDFANTGAAGDPSILRRTANTTLLVGDGDTTVIGGIFSHTTATGSNKVPFLAEIPILGFFFRDYSEDENRTELLIFVTPRIVNREAALDARRLNPIDSPQIGGGDAGGGN